ncbi:MAG TPA: response regulator transcription factor [Dehalococcoidia bacterium]|nr:response regulator transcription factor [Dehalococcoidia bacterium]
MTVQQQQPPQPAGQLRIGDLRLDTGSRVVDAPRGPVRLTAREFDLLHHLAAHPGQTFTREQLMTTVWRYAYPGDTSTVTVHMRRLRAKIERDPSHPRHLVTVWGAGYRFEP